MSVLDSPLDPQAIGWRDDASEGGVVRTEPVRGSYVQMPWKPGYISITTAGTATCAIGSGSTNNADGSGTRLSVSVAADASFANSANIQFWFQGNVFGLRYENLPGPIGCIIDGVGYAVPLNPTVDPRTGFAAGSLFPTGADYFLIADDLGTGQHFCELVFPPFTSGSTRSYLVHGYVVDAKAGYVQPSNYIHVHAVPVSITATTGGAAQSLAIASPGTSKSFWGFRRILFCNTSNAAVTITAVYSTRTSTPIWQKSIPANDTIELDWNGVIGDVNNLMFYASSSGVVNATVIGV